MTTDATPYPITLDSIPENAAAVTPSDTPGSSLGFITRAIYVGGSGNVAVNMKGSGKNVVFSNVSGYIVGRFTDILSTGTTATNIVALW